MNNNRRQQIDWWADKVHEQAWEYAQIAKNEPLLAEKLSTIANLAKELHMELCQSCKSWRKFTAQERRSEPRSQAVQ